MLMIAGEKDVRILHLVCGTEVLWRQAILKRAIRLAVISRMHGESG